MSEGGNGEKVGKLVEVIYAIYQRFGEPDYISFLDGSIHFSWGSPAQGLDRYAEIPVDPELLHHPSRTAGGGREIDFDLYGNESISESTWSKIWAGVYDLASPGQGPRRRN